MSARDIYAKLIAAGLTHEGACGLMGNMQAESGMKSNIAQRGMTALSDEEYTAAAAEWPVKFIHDGVGYGLCQWTYWSRKQALFNFAQERGAIVGDEGMQVEFCLSELCGEYPALRRFLCETQDVRAAAERVCREYERPAVNNVDARAAYAARFADMAKREGWGSAAEDSPADKEAEGTEVYWPPRMICEGMSGADVAVAQALLAAHGAELAVSNVFDAKTKNRTMEFQNGVGLHADGIIGNNTWAALLRR